jgi:ferredoxin
MKKIICYFTGTGNSLLTVRKIAARLEDAAVIPATLFAEGGDTSALREADTVGFVFPVYFDGLPAPVRKAALTCPLSPGQYIFGVATSGGAPGNALYELDAVLKSRGLRLNYGKNIDMPDNSIVFKTPEEEAAARLEKLNGAVEAVAAAVKERADMEGTLKKNRYLSLMGRVNRLGIQLFFAAENRRTDPARCNGCGTCVKLCPARNIAVKDGRAVFGKNCQWCFACLHGCPKKAVAFGRIDPFIKGQYRCPGITLNDLISR